MTARVNDERRNFGAFYNFRVHQALGNLAHASKILNVSRTEQHGKEIRMCFHFCVLPCFPWLLPVLTIGALCKEVER